MLLSICRKPLTHQGQIMKNAEENDMETWKDVDEARAIVLVEVKSILSKHPGLVLVVDEMCGLEWNEIHLIVEGVHLKTFMLDEFVEKVLPERFKFIYGE